MSEGNGAAPKPTVIYGPVAIATGPDTWRDVKGWRPKICPFLAVTPDPRSDRLMRKTWSITHIPTGGAVFDDMSWTKAIRILGVLIENAPPGAWAVADKEALMANKTEFMPAIRMAKRVYDGQEATA